MMKIVQKNIHLRPRSLPKEKPKEWVIYAIKAVVEERKRVRSLTNTSPKYVVNMKKYAELYKKKQTLVR